MRSLISPALFIICSLLGTASAIHDYSFGLFIKNENVAYNVCTDAEMEDLNE